MSGPDETVARELSALGLDPAAVTDLVELALTEDLGPAPGRDLTSEAAVPAEEVRPVALVALEDGVVAGLVLLPLVTAAAARRLGLPAPEVELDADEGDEVSAGEVIAVVTGRTRVVLAAAGTALDLVRHLSGVATATRAWVEAVAGTGVQVLDTRRTTPGLRALEQHAVRCGGGATKRRGLHDAAVVGPAHAAAAGSVAAAHDAVRRAFPDVVVQVRVDDPAGAAEAVGAGARFLLCEGLGPDALRAVVDAVRALAPPGGERVEVEARAGSDVAGAGALARTGVDFLSATALTGRAAALEVGLALDPPQGLR